MDAIDIHSFPLGNYPPATQGQVTPTWAPPRPLVTACEPPRFRIFPDFLIFIFLFHKFQYRMYLFLFPPTFITSFKLAQRALSKTPVHGYVRFHPSDVSVRMLYICFSAFMTDDMLKFCEEQVKEIFSRLNVAKYLS